MGYLKALDYKESLGRKGGLFAHLETNFFPPLPEFVVNSTMKGFLDYWNGKIDTEELTKKCYLRDIDGLYRYYSMFLDEDV